MADTPIATAAPGWREWLQALFVYPLAGVMGTAFLAFGVDQVFPSFLDEGDMTGNRIKLAVLFVAIVGGLTAWTIAVNRKHRHLALYADRLEIGTPARITVRFDELERIRVGAPMPGAIQAVVGVNQAVGAVSAKNRRAAAGLTATYRSTVVLDAPGRSVVFHAGTVVGGAALVHALAAAAPGKLAPSEYTDAELSRFGRFKAGVYPR